MKKLPISRQLSLIEHDIDGVVVSQRPTDGYINATAMCQKAGKSISHYNENQSTKDFLRALSTDAGIPISELIQTLKGGPDPKTQGTWVHPQVAINLAHWLSPEFAVQVSKWVFDWLQGKETGYMPPHVKRYMKNRAKIPHSHFSMLNELYLNFIAPLEEAGFILPGYLVPDISTGRMFSAFLRKEGVDVGTMPYYEHDFPDDKNRFPVKARLYPIELLPKFREYFHNVWLLKHAKKYFTNRSDASAVLPYLEQIIAELPSPPIKKLKK